MIRADPKASLAASSLLLLCLATCAVLAQDGAATPPSGPLTAAAAWVRVVGNTIVGTTPDGPYTEFFAPDGSVTHFDQDGKVGGALALQGPDLCIPLPDEEGDDCRFVEVDGQKGAFVDRDGNRYAFSILPGNAKGL